MDAISYSYADKAQKRIKKFIENPDSTSGVVTVPTTIATGETITIPAGRMAVLPDLQIDGDLIVDGEVFIPNGTSLSKVVEKVPSTDNAIVRFDGTTGEVQNSGVIIDDNSNVGIGVTPSAYTIGKALDIGYAGSIFGDGINYTWDCGIVQNGYQYTANGWKYRASQAAAMYRLNQNQHEWRTAPSGTAGNAITWTTAMTLSANGALNILGTANKIEIGRDTSGNYSSMDAYVECFKTNSGNNVSIQASDGSNALSVSYSAIVGGVIKSIIYSNGNFGSATNVYGSTSDRKLKENIVDTTPKLDKLMQVQVRNFNYIGQEDSKQIGVIAQEIEQIFPGVVFETKDTKQAEVTKERVIPAVEEVTDEEGNVITEAKPESIEEYTETETQETGEVTKNVKYSIIYMMMLKGMQEMRAEYTAEIEALKLRIEILEGAK